MDGKGQEMGRAEMRAILVILASCLLLGGCVGLRVYQLNSGRMVQCRDSFEGPCGVSLIECEDGHEYLCQSNVIKFDPKKPLTIEQLITDNSI